MINKGVKICVLIILYYDYNFLITLVDAFSYATYDLTIRLHGA